MKSIIARQMENSAMVHVMGDNGWTRTQKVVEILVKPYTKNISKLEKIAVSLEIW